MNAQTPIAFDIQEAEKFFNPKDDYVGLVLIAQNPWYNYEIGHICNPRQTQIVLYETNRFTNQVTNQKTVKIISK